MVSLTYMVEQCFEKPQRILSHICDFIVALVTKHQMKENIVFIEETNIYDRITIMYLIKNVYKNNHNYRPGVPPFAEKEWSSQVCTL